MMWTVAFAPREMTTRPAWWTRFLDRDIAHCLAFAPLPGGRATKVVNHTGQWLELHVLPGPPDRAQRLMIQNGLRIMLAVPESEEPDRAMLRGPMTCTEAVKAAIGLRAPFIVTPFQLHRELIRRGAQPIATEAIAP